METETEYNNTVNFAMAFIKHYNARTNYFWTGIEHNATLGNVGVQKVVFNTFIKSSFRSFLPLYKLIFFC